MSARYIATILVLIAFLAIVSVRVTAEEIIITDTLESPEWLLHGKPAPASTSLDVLIDSIIPLNTYRGWEAFKQRRNPEWLIDTVCTLGGRRVIDLFYSFDFQKRPDTLGWFRANCAKAVAIETMHEKYRLIYTDGGDPSLLFKPSFCLDTAGIRVLGTEWFQAGSGGFHGTHFWVWDSDKSAPRSGDLVSSFLDQEPDSNSSFRGFDDTYVVPLWAVQELVNRYTPELLPDSLHVLVVHPGYWDQGTLTYSSPVWLREDPVELKRGGWIEIRFAERGHSLQPLSMKYTPPGDTLRTE